MTKESLDLMTSCINFLFMMLSNGCVNDKKGVIRRELLIKTLFELRSCSFEA